MDGMISNLSESSNDYNSRLNTIRDLITNHKGDQSIDLLIDIFQNLVLDCKSIAQCNSNKYLNTIYKKYEGFNDRLYSLRVKYDDFTMLKIIGQGAFGQVQLVRHRENGQLYAMKVLNKSQMKVQEGSVFWKEERDIMTKIDSMWLVKLHYAFQDPRRLYMVMEYLPGGNLVNWMGRLEDVSESEVRFYAAEMVLAISTLHGHGFVHRDIKPDNVLLDVNGHVKLGDFGSCVRMDAASGRVLCNRAVGTPDYISPEVLLSQSCETATYGREVDWWALGVVLYEVFFGEPPFYSESLVTTYGKIMTHKQSLTFPADGTSDQQAVSEAAVDLMRSLICEASVRLGQKENAADIKAHRFFSGCHWTWDNIHECKAPFVPSLTCDWDTSHFDFEPEEADEICFVDGAGDKQLESKLFVGENLQFSGFSYSEIFGHESTRIDENHREVPESDAGLHARVTGLSKDLQESARALERLQIEKAALESQAQTAMEDAKEEQGVIRRLQADLCDLRTRHSLCQQRINKADEEKHRLCADLAALQASSTGENTRLSARVETQQDELVDLKAQLSSTEADYRRSKQQCQRLESEVRQAQIRQESVELEMGRLKQAGETRNGPKERQELRTAYEDNLKELQRQISEGQSLSAQVGDLHNEREALRAQLAKVEGQLAREKEALKGMEKTIKEKTALVDTMKAESELYHKKMDSFVKVEKDLNQRLVRLMKSKSDDKQRYEHETEDQRKKLNAIITSRTVELQVAKKSVEQLTDENGALRREVQMEKTKCSGLVEKINEIITGHSVGAREMMISEDLRQGVIGKRSGRYYNEVMKQNKRLQGVCEQLETDSSRREKELKAQIEGLSREREQLEAENGTLRGTISYYENIGVTTGSQNRASVLTISSQGSYDSGYPPDTIKVTSTPQRTGRTLPRAHPLNLSAIRRLSPPPSSSTTTSSTSSSSSPSPRYRDLTHESSTNINDSTTTATMDDTLGFNLSLSSHLSLPEGQLDVNVKVKGKKMSWQRRFVKVDNDNLVFFNQSLETCHLKIPLSSLMMVRRAKVADVIHAKAAEVPRIFQIFYDKNSTLYSELMMRRSMSESNSSVNTAGSGRSGDSGGDVVDSSSVVIRPADPRKSSVAKFLPLFGSRSAKAAAKAARPPLSMSTVAPEAVLLRGHVLQPLAPASAALRGPCGLCKQPLWTPPAPTPSGLRLVTDTSSAHCDALSSTVDPAKAYRCYHCAASLHGTHIDSAMAVCDGSVAIQLCRAESEAHLLRWLACLDSVVKATSSASMHRHDHGHKARAATLG